MAADPTDGLEEAAEGAGEGLPFALDFLSVLELEVTFYASVKLHPFKNYFLRLNDGAHLAQNAGIARALTSHDLLRHVQHESGRVVVDVVIHRLIQQSLGLVVQIFLSLHALENLAPGVKETRVVDEAFLRRRLNIHEELIHVSNVIEKPQNEHMSIGAAYIDSGAGRIGDIFLLGRRSIGFRVFALPGRIVRA